MTINHRTLPAFVRTLAFSAAFCLILGGIACNSVGPQRSCEAITADIFSNLSDAGMDPSEEVICRGLELTLEAFDAGCTVTGGGTREQVLEQIELNCSG